jgi:DinB superfamily
MYEVAQNIRTIIDQTLPLLRAIPMSRIAEKPNPAKWSKKEIIGHLIDSACNNQQKFIRTMAQPHLDFVGYEQNHWVASQNYQQVNWHNLLDFWTNYNYHIAHIIEHVNPSVLNNTISINGTGPFSLGFIMSDYAQHLTHHLKQVLPDADLKSTFVNVYNA